MEPVVLAASIAGSATLAAAVINATGNIVAAAMKAKQSVAPEAKDPSAKDQTHIFTHRRSFRSGNSWFRLFMIAISSGGLTFFIWSNEPQLSQTSAAVIALFAAVFVISNVAE